MTRAALGALPSRPGTYGLALRLPETTRCRIGALGGFLFPEGRYLYVGSAWGPGGLRARVGRHLRGTGKSRWHIDYLRRVADPVALWLAPEGRLECWWAAFLADHPRAEIVVPRFGASDCRCAAHLFRLLDSLQAYALPGTNLFW